MSLRQLADALASSALVDWEALLVPAQHEPAQQEPAQQAAQGELLATSPSIDLPASHTAPPSGAAGAAGTSGQSAAQEA